MAFVTAELATAMELLSWCYVHVTHVGLVQCYLNPPLAIFHYFQGQTRKTMLLPV